MTSMAAKESTVDRFNPLPDDLSSGDCFDEYGAYLPTPGQIEEACLRIQAEWTPRERRKRYAGEISDLLWNLPVCRLQNAG